MRNYRIQRIRILPPTVSRPFSAFYTVNWIEIERPYSSHSEKKTKKQSQTLSRRRRRRCTCRQTTRISLYFFEPKKQKNRKTIFLNLCRWHFSWAGFYRHLSRFISRVFSFSVSQKCYGNVSTKHHTHRCQLRRVISSFLYSAKKKKKNVKSKKTRSWVGKLWLDQYYSTGFFWHVCIRQ